MSFNAAKCNVLRFTRSRTPSLTQYHLHHTPLECLSSAKYLGVTLNSNLTWSSHIDTVIKKSNKALGMIRRNLKTAPKEVKSSAYQSLVRPHLEYASAIWDPHTANDKERLEAVQRRAARFCCWRWNNLSSPTQMIAELGWVELWRRREVARLTLMFKLTHGLLNVDTHHLLIPINRPTRHSHQYSFQRPASNKNYFNLSFFPRTINDWNNLPASLVQAPSVEAFNTSLRARVGSLR